MDFVIDGSYSGRDQGDAHVHAAAIACGADVLITSNVADFVWADDSPPYDIMTPDEFFVLVDDSSPWHVVDVVQATCSYWVSRTGQADLPRALVAAGCPVFAERVRAHLRGLM